MCGGLPDVRIQHVLGRQRADLVDRTEQLLLVRCLLSRRPPAIELEMMEKGDHLRVGGERSDGLTPACCEELQTSLP